MKIVLLYSSSHGRTRKVVTEVLGRLRFQPAVFDVKSPPPKAVLEAAEALLFFTPTYGDEELQEDMEDFIENLDLDLRGKAFVICELGNYYGYDSYSFGAMPILRRRLLQMNARELFTPLSLDSYPRVNWEHLHAWVEQLNACLDAHV